MEPAPKENQSVTKCEEMFVCSCFFNSAFGLFCRHILHVRKSLQSEKKLLTDCIARWHCGHQSVVSDFLPAAAMELLESHANDDDVEEFAEAARYDTMPRERRFAIALLKAKKLSNMIDEFGGATFDSHILLLQTVRGMLQKNISSTLMKQALLNVPSRSSTSVCLLPEVQKIDDGDPTLITATGTSEWETEPSQDRETTLGFILPGATTRPPGRPKGSTAKKSFSRKASQTKQSAASLETCFRII